MSNGPTTEQAEQIVEWLIDYGVHEAEEFNIRPDYSGRGMYEDTCVGIVASETRWLFIAIGALVQSGDFDEQAFEWFTRRDSMGYDTIVY